MNWDAIGAVREVVGALAVVLTPLSKVVNLFPTTSQNKNTDYGISKHK
jgi:hypothetical protein